MDPFLRYFSFLMVLMVLGGCGQTRSSAQTGRPYAVTLGNGVLVAPESHSTSAEQCSEKRTSSGSLNFGGTWSGGGGGGSSDGLLAALVVVVAVVIVVAVVVAVVDSATPDQVTERYYVTLSGEGVPLESVTISSTNHMFLEDHQYDALVRGAYTRAVIRPAVWEGRHGAPIQEVQVTASHGNIAISLAQDASAESVPTAPENK